MAKTYLCLLYGLSLAVAGRAGGAEPAVGRFSFTQPHMGTRFRIILYAPDRAAATRASRAAFARIADLDGIMTDYRSTSELMHLCEKAGKGPVHVSLDLWRPLARAQEVSRLSGGAFDITVGPVVRLWRQARKAHRLPDPKELEKARQLVGYRMMHLDPRAHTVTLDKPGMQLDLGGIGKGYAADEALRELRRHGVTRALVAAGGDIAVGDAPPGKEGWTIGIAPLDNPEARPRHYLLLHNQAVSTSGDVEQHLDVNGKRYSHIIDPRTGMGLEGRNSVTVVGPNGLTVDPLTKVVSVLGPREGIKILDKLPGVSAFVVRKTDKGEETFASKRFTELMRPGKEGSTPGGGKSEGR